MLNLNYTAVICRTFSLSTANTSHKSKGKLFEILKKMPKNPVQRLEIQRQRVNSKELSEKYSPSTVFLQVIGSGAHGAPSSLYLFTDQKRYLFNCGEGTQRLAHEHKVKLSKLEHIFITNKSWKNIGGLPGVSLTLQDVGVPEINLHGPPGLDVLYQATRRFIVMKDMKINTVLCDSTNEFEDNCMTVKYVVLGPEQTAITAPYHPSKKAKLHEEDTNKEFVNDDTDYYSYKTNNKKRDSPKAKKLDEVALEREKVIDFFKNSRPCTVAFICRLKKRLGTLDLVKCVKMGVKPGPLLGRLKSGEDVTLDNGTVVRSQDVKTPDDPGPIFIVVEVPDISYLREEKFKIYYDEGKNSAENLVSLVAHFTPPHVLRDDRYQTFMKRFGSSTEHLIINEDNACQGLVAVHRMQHKLNLIHDRVFPLLMDRSIPCQWEESSKAASNGDNQTVSIDNFKKVIEDESRALETMDMRDDTIVPYLSSRTLTTYYLRPNKGLDRTSEVYLKVDEYIKEAMQAEGVAESLEEFKQSKPIENTNEYPKVVFLGTGSSMPNKTRNTSGILLRIDESHSMIVDCGEGTFGQLVRIYGTDGIADVMKTIKSIYVSHLHADHHLGLITLLQARQNLAGSNSPLYLLAPGQIMTWISVYDQQFEPIRDQFHLIPNSTLQRHFQDSERPSSPEAVSPAVLESMGVGKVETCLVSHCPNAFGVAITTAAGLKITYSGDTIPCSNLVRLGMNSDLLIHEATMEDELADEARIKMHSTSSQAVQVGSEMNAKFVLLTHFSQRYARLPRLNSLITEAGNVGVAFDNMQISLGDLELLTRMYEPLQRMFAEHALELEMKAAKRNLQKERSTFRVVDKPTADSNIATPESEALKS